MTDKILIPPQNSVSPKKPPIHIVHSQVLKAPKQVNARKAIGPHCVSPRVLKICADQLADVYKYIFNTSLTQASLLQDLYNHSSPKIPETLTLDDFRPVKFTPIAMK